MPDCGRCLLGVHDREEVDSVCATEVFNPLVFRSSRVANHVGHKEKLVSFIAFNLVEEFTPFVVETEFAHCISSVNAPHVRMTMAGIMVSTQ